MKILLIALMFTLASCATGIDKERSYSLQGESGFVYHAVVKQHFINTSELEAYEVAKNYCAGYDAKAQFSYREEGCVLLCGSEYHAYHFNCVANTLVKNKNKNEDELTCKQWGIERNNDKYSECMLRLYEVRMAVEAASERNTEIQRLSDNQRKAAEEAQAYSLLFYGSQMLQQTQQNTYTVPTQPFITPFACRKYGNSIRCQ